MMGFFKQPKPRRFSHPYQYVDERKERIKEIEMRAKKELGMQDQESLTGATVKGSFLQLNIYRNVKQDHGTRR